MQSKYNGAVRAAARLLRPSMFVNDVVRRRAVVDPEPTPVVQGWRRLKPLYRFVEVDEPPVFNPTTARREPHFSPNDDHQGRRSDPKIETHDGNSKPKSMSLLDRKAISRW